MERLLSVGDVAKRLGVSVDVVRSLTSTGRLKAVRTGGGHRRYSPAEIARFVATQRRGPPNGPAPRPIPRPILTPLVLREPLVDRVVSSHPETPRAVERTAAAERESAETSHRRLEGLKQYGCSVAAGTLMPTEWQARAVEDLQGFVTEATIPPWISDWQARQFVAARVEGVLARYRDSEARRRKQQEDERRLKALIDYGISHASSKTIIGWDVAERERARREVQGVLRAEVKVDWSEAEVRDLVDDVLAEWGEEDDDEDDGEDEDGN